MNDLRASAGDDVTDLIDLAALRKARVNTEPFPYLIVPGFLKAEGIEAIEKDYPALAMPGSVPLPSLSYGPAFGRLMAQIQSSAMTEVIGDKLSIDLKGRPTMVTVRGQCRATDGQIHTDSRTKLVTVLIYMNGSWEAPGGRLRLLRSPASLDDMVAEVPPERGTLLAFLNTENAWHGHASFEGQRRAIQLNWVSDAAVVWREQFRHRVSAFFKRLKSSRRERQAA
ncbi:2OG-Fe(II) oxygenase [Candidatus Raskinella chloraquaticus]|uniref:Prolyl 4-hydroxylase alpha subunit Fe(2+) 2OG dioxygenase domain-containing protein n=1 Tax=Candidatus Raskinella chloraquaticus TaxID=1951219 RepID=A0A1W9I508_9HYPH|nr:MAG: hypothetical protein A4S15_03530 [Proteobacteria bacterium SG_bin8]